jgi:hypothetical protein
MMPFDQNTLKSIDIGCDVDDSTLLESLAEDIPEMAPSIRQRLREIASRMAEPAGVTDTAMLDFLAAEYLDLRTFEMLIALSNDADVGWRCLQYHMGEKEPREVSVSHHDDLRAAIRNAMQALGYAPAAAKGKP